MDKASQNCGEVDEVDEVPCTFCKEKITIDQVQGHKCFVGYNTIKYYDQQRTRACSILCYGHIDAKELLIREIQDGEAFWNSTDKDFLPQRNSTGKKLWEEVYKAVKGELNSS
ncbi:hypothetical protein QAD02_017667 [Eretmocerus hayati]|uniref:Uncharacterized protein n=1 Tax=Eretmocerus hayati TaxID=131215 RepID=A0ACC2PEK3_9HYME|nr:hypothetical protein QAD02_017667 [Eretmocerus hayati]